MSRKPKSADGMRIATLLAATLVCGQVSAAQIDTLTAYNGPLNACMYRYGLTALGLRMRPASVRKGVFQICATEIEKVISALIPPDPDGKFSIDVEGGEIERKKASKSPVLKLLIDDFMKNYQEAYK